MLLATVIDQGFLARCVPQAQAAIADYVQRVSTDLTDAVVSITLCLLAVDEYEHCPNRKRCKHN